MYKNILMVVALTILSVALLGWIAKPSGKPSPATASVSNGILETAEDQYDFGNISMAAGKVTHNFTIKNNGPEELAIEKIYTSCMCTEAKLVIGSKAYGPFGMAGHGFIPKISAKLAPGAEASISAVFDPAAHGPAGIGKIQRSVYLENNAGEPLELHFSATVTP